MEPPEALLVVAETEEEDVAVEVTEVGAAADMLSAAEHVGVEIEAAEEEEATQTVAAIAAEEEEVTQTVVATAADEVGLIVAEEVVGSAEDVVEEVRKKFTGKFSTLLGSSRSAYYLSLFF